MKFNFRNTLVFVLILHLFAQISQSATPDSLLTKIAGCKDTEKPVLLNKLAEIYLDSNSAKVKEYAGSALEYALKTGNKNEMASALRSIGLACYYDGNYNEALQNYNASLKCYQEIGDQEGIAKSYNSIGIVYDDWGNYSRALEYYHASLKINEQLKNEIRMAYSLNNIGAIYKTQKSYDKALEYYTRSLHICESLSVLGKPEEVMLAKKCIAIALNNIGNIYHNKGDNAKAIDYYSRSFSEDSLAGNKIGMAASYSNMGISYEKQGEYHRALVYYFKSLRLKKELGNKRGIAITYANLGNIYTLLNKTDSALYYCNSALVLSNEISLPETEMTAYHNLAEIYRKKNDLKQAYHFLVQFSQLRDSLFSLDKSQSIQQLMASFDAEKQIQELELLNKEKELKDLEILKNKAEIRKHRVLVIVFILAAVIILISAISLIFFLKYKETRNRITLQNQLNEYMQKALSQQMNPHFIFNTLNSIQYYILQNDNESSIKYLSMFAKLMRITLDNSLQTTIPLRDELKALELYLELEALRFENKFDYSIIVDKNNEILGCKVPTLLIQPYVENAIWHGLMHKDGKGKLEIELLLQPDSLLCRIEDNGIGREKAMEIKSKKGHTHTSLGAKITETRLNLINSLYGSKMNVQYIDLKDPEGIACGTRVELYMPILS